MKRKVSFLILMIGACFCGILVGDPKENAPNGTRAYDETFAALELAASAVQPEVVGSGLKPGTPVNPVDVDENELGMLNLAQVASMTSLESLYHLDFQAVAQRLSVYLASPMAQESAVAFAAASSEHAHEGVDHNSTTRDTHNDHDDQEPGNDSARDDQ